MVVATLGIDNISAVPEPSAALMVGMVMTILSGKRLKRALWRRMIHHSEASRPDRSMREGEIGRQ
jgi:hypothetical protein